MKISLVYPPWQFYSPSKLYPLGISYLASYLIQNGYDEVELMDLNYLITEPKKVIKEAIKYVERSQPDIVGLTCWTVHLPFCIEFVRAYKQKYPNVLIILGGVHASSQPEEMFKLCPVDFIVRGEGEVTFVELLRTLQNKKNFEDVNGMSFRKKGKIQHNPDRELIGNLDTLPMPDYNMLSPIEYYQPLNRKYVFSILASRGCPYRCIFCSANKLWRCQRQRSPKNIIREIEWLINDYGLGYIRFEDDTITMQRDWALELFKMMRNLPVSFECLTRIDKVDHDLLREMRAAGCEGIYHGIETASPRLLKVLKKGMPDRITDRFIKELIHEEVNLGLNPTVSAMIGIPTETREEILQTFDLMSELKRLGAKTQLWIMTPYPDTDAIKLYNNYLVKIDRWREMKQFDVFSAVPRQAYGRFLKKYEDLIPDNWMFSNEIKNIEELKSLYTQGAKQILGEFEFV
jgi:anaerobic magnesium-protoporphyrin IX monomethyl ester cyclase